MRRRLVEGATPASLTPAPAVAAAPATAETSLAGRWYGRGGALLDIRQASPTDLEWDWEYSSTTRGANRASGTGTVSGDRVSLVGRQSAAAPTPVMSFDLTRQGNVLRGVSRGHNNLPVNVEFTRTPP
jgi:hypothetical protein